MTDQRLPGGLSCDSVRDLAASFVLDALPEDEMAAMREHLATCPEPHPEIAELAGVVPVLHAAVQPAEPPAALKDRIMAAAAAELEARTAPATTAPDDRPVDASATQEPTQIGAARPRRWSWALGIAAVLAIALLGGWNLSLRSELDQAQAYQRRAGSPR